MLLASARWPTTETHREAYLSQLTQALRDARTPREKAGVIRVMVMIEGQNQADDHLMEKYRRIDHGQGTDAVVNAKALPSDVIEDILDASNSRTD